MGRIALGVVSGILTLVVSGATLAQPVNDDCTGAIVIAHDPMGSGFGAPGGALVLGDTTTATVDIGSPGGCDEPSEPQFDLPAFEDPIPHICPGVWYRFTGMGNVVRVSTDLPETAFDTTIAVYCSDDLNDSCSSLACIAGNRDIGSGFDFNVNSEIEICAELGRDYFVLVTGNGFSAGAFGLVAEERRDEMDQPIACVPTGDCAFECIFEIPAGAIDELTDFGPLSEACDELNIDGNNNGCDGPPNAQGNYQGLFPKIQVGDVVMGTLWTGDGNRDVDNYLFEGLPTDGSPAIVDFSWGAESPMRIRTESIFSTWFSPCAGLAVTAWNRSAAFCGQSGSTRQIHEAGFSQDNDGRLWDEQGFKATMNFEIRSLVSAAHGGLPCGAFNRYWFRLDDVIFPDDCDPVPDPIGQPTLDNPSNPLMGEVVFGDWDDEAIQPTFNGECGAGCLNDFAQGNPDACDGEGNTRDIFAGEPCDQWGPSAGPCEGNRRLFGCHVTPNTEGDFLLLRPGVPLVGRLSAHGGLPEPQVDLDWYIFEVLKRSVVSIQIDAGVSMSAKLLENRCGNTVFDQQLFAVAATTGSCGSRNLSVDDLVTLDAGKYIVLVRWEDLFSSGGSLLLPRVAACSQESLGKYVLEVATSPAPQCTGDANADGVVDFNDITATLGMWGANYNPSPGTGIGDANDDGFVTFADVTTILGNWLSGCP